jgi:hypothetical protein
MWREVEGCRRCGEKWRVVVEVEKRVDSLASTRSSTEPCLFKKHPDSEEAGR